PGAASELCEVLGLGGAAVTAPPFAGPVEETATPNWHDATLLAVVAVDAEGRLTASASAVLRAAQWIAQAENGRPAALVLVPSDDEIQRRAAGRIAETWHGPVVLLPAVGATCAMR